MALTMNLTNVQREAPTFKTATGEIVTLTDAKGGQYFRELQTTIDPVQDLHGYDNPWPAGGGKNKFNPTTGGTNPGTYNGITYSKNADGSYSFSGTSTASTWIDFGNVALPAGTWTASVTKTGSYTGTLGFGANDGAFITYPNLTTYPRTVTSSEETTGKFGINFPTGATITGTLTLWIQIELGSTATAWTPYSNECPISGWSSAKVTRTGKNLCYVSDSNLFPRGDNLPIINNASTLTAYAKVPKNTNLVFSCATEPYRKIAYGFEEEPQVGTIGHTLPFTVVTANSYAFNSGEYEYVAFYYGSTEHPQTNVQFELGSTATDYEPYNGQTFTISLGDTRYGAVLDVTRGKLRVTMESKDMGSLSWHYGNGVFDSTISTMITPTNDLLCSQYSTTPYSTTSINMPDKSIKSYGNSTLKMIYVKDTAYSDAPTFKTAMSGVQLVYSLATPIEVDLTPTEITTLLGTNNLWSDTGEVTVTYKVDPNAEPTLTLASPLRANLGSLRSIVPEAEEIIAESEDPENGANLTTESEVQNGET